MTEDRVIRETKDSAGNTKEVEILGKNVGRTTKGITRVGGSPIEPGKTKVLDKNHGQS